MEEARPKLRLLSAALAEVCPSLTADRPAEPGLPLTAEQAFRRYSGYVAAVAFRILGSDEQIDDVVQDVFLVAVKDLGRLREPEAMKGWLATIAVRVAGRRLRLRRLRRLLGLGQPLDYELAVPAARPEARVLLGQIYTLLDELAVDKRLAWVLRHVQGEPLDEVARLCGCSLAAAKRRIDAAHQFLQRKLSDE